MVRKIRILLKCNRGSVEAAMVLVPLMVLFLVGMQIAIATHARNVQAMSAQGDASKRAISGSFQSGDEFIHIDSSGDGQNLDLLIVRRNQSLVDLLPTFLAGASGNREIDISGFAVVENQR